MIVIFQYEKVQFCGQGQFFFKGFSVSINNEGDSEFIKFVQFVQMKIYNQEDILMQQKFEKGILFFQFFNKGENNNQGCFFGCVEY